MNMTKRPNYSFMYILVAFIVFQPLIDMLTTVTVKTMNLPISFGILMRLAYMFAMALWVLYALRFSQYAKWILYYLIGLAILVLGNFLMNMQLKDPYYMMQEVTFYSKAIYFPIVLLGLILVFEQLAKERIKLQAVLIQAFTIVGATIGTVFLVSFLTGTAMSNYGWYKTGWKAWFLSGNEIGSTMAILLPVTALYAMNKMKSWQQLYAWIPFILLAFGMILLGTKVGYGGILITLIAVIGVSLIQMFWTREQPRPYSIRTMITASVLLIGLLVTTPFTPVYSNIFGQMQFLGVTQQQIDEALGEEGEEGEGIEMTAEQFENLVFSSREVYRADYGHYWQRATLGQKLFGMGYAGLYEHPTEDNPNRPNIVEMDFHDYFYSFGIIGFLYIVAPIMYLTVTFLARFFRRFKNNCNAFYLMSGVSYVIGLGIALTAGHVLMAPAVSIYLAFLLALLTVEIRKVKDL